MGSSCGKTSQDPSDVSQMKRTCREMPAHAPDWTLLHSLSVKKWKTFSKRHNLVLQDCLVTFEDPLDNWWNSGACVCGSHDKQDMLLSYKHHGSCVDSKSYSYNPLLQPLLDDAELVTLLSSSGHFCVMLFAVDSLEDTKHYLLYLFKDAVTPGMYFFLEKWSPLRVVHQCSISNDESYVVLLVSEESGESRGFEMQAYCKRPVAYDTTFKGSMFELEYEVPGIFPFSGVPRLIFDPRYGYSRLGLVNMKAIHWEEVNSYVTVYDLIRKRPYLRHRSLSTTEARMLMDATYSRDGELIIALVLMANQKTASPSKLSRSLVIFSTNNLKEVKVIDIGYDSIGSCFANFMPVFSASGRQMSVRVKKKVHVYQLPGPRSLQGHCRAVILTMYPYADVNKLLIPQNIKNFLKFQSTKY